jgi:hypothetical protein
MFDPLADLNTFFDPEEWACEVVLWPGQPEERSIYGIFDQPSELAEVGGEVGHIALSPTLRARSSDVEGIRQGDPLRVMPCPRLGIVGGDYRVKKHLPDGHGVSLLELMQ